MGRLEMGILIVAAGLLLCLLAAGVSAEERVFVVNSYVHQPTAINFSTVVMLRGSDLAVLGTSDNLGQAAHSIAYDPLRDELWVTVPEINRTVVLDSRDLSIKRSMKIKDLVGPMGIAFLTITDPPSPPRMLAYLTGTDSGTVVVVDVATAAYLDTVTVGGNPYAVAFQPDGRAAWVLDTDNNNLSVIRTSDNSKVATLTWGAAGDRLQEMAFNSTRLFISNQRIPGRIEVVRISDGVKLTPIPTDSFPRGLDISPDGKHLLVGYCTSTADATVALLRLSDSMYLDDAPISYCARRLATRPDGSRTFAVDHNSDEIFAYDLAAGSISPAGSADLNTVPGLGGASPVGIVRADITIARYGAVFRPSSWNNWILSQDLSHTESRDHLGLGTDLPLVADFNNGGVMDRAVFRDGDWKIDYEMDGDVDAADHFGMAGDIPVAGYLDRDRVTDRAVFRDGEWILDLGMDGDVDGRDHFGMAGDIPLIGDFNNDWVPDRAVFRGSAWHNWIIDYDMDGDVDRREHFGSAGDVPLAGRIDRDLFWDRAVFRNGEWIIDYRMDGSVDWRPWYGWDGDIPLVWWDL